MLGAGVVPKLGGVSDFKSVDPPRNFSISVQERVRALTIGVPAYAARKRHIEDLEDTLIGALVELHDELTLRRTAPAIVAERLLTAARAADLAKINDLVAKHNRFYPIEANLAIEPATGAYLVAGRRWHPVATWSPETLVDAAVARLEQRSRRA